MTTDAKFTVAREWSRAARSWIFGSSPINNSVTASLADIQRLTWLWRMTVDMNLCRQVENLPWATSAPTLQALARHLDPVDPQRMIVRLLHMAYHHRLDLPLDTAPLFSVHHCDIGRAILSEVAR